MHPVYLSKIFLQSSVQQWSMVLFFWMQREFLLRSNTLNTWYFNDKLLYYPQTDSKRNSYCATDEDSWPHQWKLLTVGLEFVRKWYARDTGFKPRQPTLFTLNWRSTMVQWPSSLSLQDKFTMRRNLLNWRHLVSISKKLMFYVFVMIRIY